MRTVLALAVVFVSVVALACGGGGGGPGTGLVEKEKKVTGPIQTVEVRMTDDGIQTQELRIDPGNFQVKVINEGAKTRQFVCHRWRIQVEAEPGQTKEGKVATEKEAGEYDCFELTRAAKPQWKAKIIVEG